MTNAVEAQIIERANRNISGAIPFFYTEKPKSDPLTVSRFAVKTEAERNYYNTLSRKQDEGNGMDAFSLDTYNLLLEKFLYEGNIRNAALLILSGNWGTRFGDTVSVRYCHIFDENGQLRTSFSLPSGEDKTNKKNIYYNNDATKWIIERLLADNPDKTRDDYIFTSNSRNKPMVDLIDVEAKEIFGVEVERAEKQLAEVEDKKQKLFDLYYAGAIKQEEFTNQMQYLEALKASYDNTLRLTKENLASYSNPASEGKQIQKKMSHTAAEDIIKDGLAELGIFGKNCKKGNKPNCDGKYNTHSFRKTFGKFFYTRGVELKDRGILTIDPDVLVLLQKKFMHSDGKITQRYDTHTEEAFEIICTNLNLGLDIIQDYERKENIWTQVRF